MLFLYYAGCDKNILTILHNFLSFRMMKLGSTSSRGFGFETGVLAGAGQ